MLLVLKSSMLGWLGVPPIYGNHHIIFEPQSIFESPLISIDIIIIIAWGGLQAGSVRPKGSHWWLLSWRSSFTSVLTSDSMHSWACHTLVHSLALHWTCYPDIYPDFFYYVSNFWIYSFVATMCNPIYVQQAEFATHPRSWYQNFQDFPNESSELKQFPCDGLRHGTNGHICVVTLQWFSILLGTTCAF